ncbi:DNA primase small subunit PRIM1 [Vairimorpha necatrix]
MYNDKYTRILLKYKIYLFNQGFIKKEDLDDRKIFSKHIKILYDKMFLKIDQEVTKSLIHLIKMPFCVHPATTLLSLPIDPNSLDNFEKTYLIKLKDVIENPNVLNESFRILDSWICSKKKMNFF